MSMGEGDIEGWKGEGINENDEVREWKILKIAYEKFSSKSAKWVSTCGPKSPSPLPSRHPTSVHGYAIVVHLN